MSIFKQIHNKFWQNDFVLGLSAEERYFYIYLITNSMTTQCGIYKFNRRLAELETGYAADKIEKYLEKFQEYGKVVISQTTTEIMIVNWFKHNFKSSKKIILSVNKELRDVKDKTLLQKLYDSCSDRQIPVAEIFSGIILPGVENGKDKDSAQKESESSNSGITHEHSILPSKPSEADSFMLSGLQWGEGVAAKSKKKEENLIEELVLMDYSEDESLDIGGGTTIVSWGFAEEAEIKDGLARSRGESNFSNDVVVSSTA